MKNDQIYDKDKLIVIANICISNVSRDTAMYAMNQMQQHLKGTFDCSVKTMVMPVLEPSLQKIEIFNADKCDEKILKKLNENYEKVIESFSK